MEVLYCGSLDYSGVEISGVIVLGQKCDVMAGDSLLTLCCPSASSADTNTSNLFQLRPALLSESIAASPPPTNMLVTGHQSSQLLRVQVRIRHCSGICLPPSAICRCLRKHDILITLTVDGETLTARKRDGYKPPN